MQIIWLAWVATKGNTVLNNNAIPTNSTNVRACDPSKILRSIQLVTLQQEIQRKKEIQMMIPKPAMVNDTTIQTSLTAS